LNDLIEITTEPLSLDDLVRRLGHPSAAGDPPGRDPEAGALVTFSGIVRGTEGEEKIEALDYSHYGEMAGKEMKRLAVRARAEWPVQRIGLVHRVGRVGVGEPSVIVAVSAGHRDEAFQAARFLIDELKKTVPIWKRVADKPSSASG
jgi:molybdopterin synthase catalytic subunit